MVLTMHVITMNRRVGIYRLLSATNGCFDNVRVCDGGSYDDTVSICKQFDAKVCRRKWDDDMSAQHNKLLRKAKKGEWILVMDDDECPSPQLLTKLRQYALEGKNGKEYTIVRIPSIMEINGVQDWSINGLIAAIKNGEQPGRFCKENLFLYDGAVRYTGNAHYMLDPGHTQDWVRRDMIPEPYIHYKTTKDQIECDIQQAFINPITQGVLEADATVLHRLFRQEGIDSSIAMLAYLQAGECSRQLQDFFVARSDPSLGAIANFFVYYFLILHAIELKKYHNVLRELSIYPAVQNYLKNLGGWRPNIVNKHIDGKYTYWLQLRELDINPDLASYLNTDEIELSERFW